MLITRRTLVAFGVFFPTAQLCAAEDRNIAIGGTVGFDSLSKPSASTDLRATKRVRLYVHDYVWQMMSVPQRAAVVKAFQGTGPAIVELGVSRHYQKFWASHFETYDEVRLAVDTAYINLIEGENALTLDEWKAYVDAARNHKVNIVAPIFAPNKREWMIDGFSSPRWDLLRAEAAYGGGIAVDSPAWYYLAHPTKYRQFVQDEVKWGRLSKLRTAWIISPPRTANGSFRQPTMEMLRELEKARATPEMYVVENYMAHPPSGFRFVVGDERTPDTVAATALWLTHLTERH